MKSKFTFLLLLFSICAFSQNTFIKVISNISPGPAGYGVCVTGDSGIVICGTGASNITNGGDWNPFAYKLTSNGNSAWFRQLAESLIGNGYDVLEASDGSIISSGMCGVTSPTENIFLCKQTSSGNTSWIKRYDGQIHSNSSSLIESSEHGFLIGGYYATNMGIAPSQPLILKIDSAGNLTWKLSFTLVNRGGIFYSATPTFDGGYVFLGVQADTISGCSILLVKIDSAGTNLWTKVLDGLDFDIGYCIKQTADSGFIIAGSVLEPLPGQGLTEEGLLLRTDVDGNYLWAKKYVNATTKFSKVSIDSNGDFIVAGRTTGSDSDLVILKMNSAGNIIWQHYYAISGNDDAYDLGFTGDGYVLVGNNQTLQGKQIVIIKTDLSGTNSCLNYNPNIIADTVTYSDKAFIQQIVIDTTGSNLNGIISNSGTGQLSSYCLNTNINEEEFHHFNIYPNPASSFIFLKNESLDSKSKFQIVNLMGQIVFEESLLDQNTISISVKELPNGIYNIINIDSNSKSISKLIVQHE